MMLSMDQPEYVIDATTVVAVIGTPIGKRVANSQEYRTGYRAESHYTFCDGYNELSVQWTHFPKLEMKHSRSGAHLFGVLNFPNADIDDESGESSIRDKSTCYFIDALFKRKLTCCPSIYFSLHAGVQYGYLSFKENISYPVTGQSRLIQSRSRIRGVGPEIGAEYRYIFLRDWHFGGRVDNGWLVSETTKSFRDVTSDGTMVAYANNDDYKKLIPTLDLRLGVGFSPIVDLFNNRCCTFALDFEVGYEFIAFIHGVDRILFVEEFNGGSSFNEMQTLSLHGPYVHIGVVF